MYETYLPPFEALGERRKSEGGDVVPTTVLRAILAAVATAY